MLPNQKKTDDTPEKTDSAASASKNKSSPFHQYNFFHKNRNANALVNQYGEQIQLIDAGSIPFRFRPHIVEILKKLRQVVKEGKMTTFCITAFNCSIKVISLSAGEKFSSVLAEEKKDSTHHVLILKSSGEGPIITSLFDKGKELARQTILSRGITLDIYSTLSQLPEGALSLEKATELFHLLEGLLFKEQSLSPIQYRVAISGFSDANKATELQKKLEKLAIFVPFAKKGSSHLLPSATVPPTPSEHPDPNKLTVFTKFLIEATAQLKNIQQIEQTYQVSLQPDHLNLLENIQALLNNKEFCELHTQYNKIKTCSTIEFIILFLYKDEAFDYQTFFDNAGIKISNYRIPQELKEKFQQLDFDRDDNSEFERYRIDGLSLKNIYPNIYQPLFDLADKIDINFSSIQNLYKLFDSVSALAMAARSAHCSEDALLKEMKNNKEAFTAPGSNTFIFSVKLISGLEGLESLEDIPLEPRCSNCKVHFSHDLSEILGIPAAEHSVQAAFPRNTSNANSISFSAEKTKPYASSGMSFSFQAAAPGIFNLLKKGRPNDGEDTIYGGGNDFSSFLSTAILAYNAQQEYKTPLLRAAALCDLIGVNKCLETIKENDAASDINAQDKEGNTAMHYAAKIDQYDTPEVAAQILFALLQSGGDPSLCNKQGEDVLTVFLGNSHEVEEGIFSEVLNLLYMAPININP